MDKKIENEDALKREEQLDETSPDQSAVESVPETTSAEIEAPKNAPSRKRLVVAVTAGIVVLITLSVAAWYWLAGPGVSMDKQSESAVTAMVAPYEEHAAAVFSEIKGEVAVVSTITSLGGQTSSGVLVYDFAPYQVPGTAYRVLPATGAGYTVAVDDATAADRALKVADGLLTGKGAMKRTSDSVNDAGGLASQSLAQVASYAIYRSDDALCSLAHLVSSGEHAVSIGCADIKAYSETARAVQPLADAYAKANPAKIEGTQIFSAPQIADGKEGTKQATLYQRIPGQTGGAVLYYSAKDSSSWQLIGGSFAGTVPCKVFTTAEQKTAFAGGTCYDESTKKDRAI